MPNPDGTRWLLLIHQIPPKPDYFRVKIRRRLRQVGAVAIKQAVYILPKSDPTLEDFNWILKEIAEGGGDACLCEVVFLGGLSRDRIMDLFREARDEDYETIVKEVRALTAHGSDKTKECTSNMRSEVRRLKKRFDHVTAIDFFSSPGRGAAEGALSDAATRLRSTDPKSMRPSGSGTKLSGRTWVTRRGVFVDRIACAWLIRGFIDHKARFKFVSDKTCPPRPGEVRFDMFDAEFTHEGNRCSFEVMAEHFTPDDPALAQIAQIIHDMDLKDEKFARPEAAGIRTLFEGIAASHDKDEERLERGARILDELYALFRRRSGP